MGVHERARAHLAAAGVSHIVRVHAEMAAPIRSPSDFAAALGYPLARVMKTLVCHAKSTDAYVAVVCPMDTRVDFKGVARELDSGRLEVADPAQLESVTDYPPNGVSPLGLDARVRVVVARQALDYDTVLVGGGVLGVEVELSPLDLVLATDAAVVDFAIAR